ncbi:hypothetical protein [Desulfurobacterium sp.]
MREEITKKITKETIRETKKALALLKETDRRYTLTLIIIPLLIGMAMGIYALILWQDVTNISIFGVEFVVKKGEVFALTFPLGMFFIPVPLYICNAVLKKVSKLLKKKYLHLSEIRYLFTSVPFYFLLIGFSATSIFLPVTLAVIGVVIVKILRIEDLIRRLKEATITNPFFREDKNAKRT